MEERWSVNKRYHYFLLPGDSAQVFSPAALGFLKLCHTCDACHSQTGRVLIKGNLCCLQRQWHPTPVLLLGKSHGWRNLVGCSPWGREESATTERLHFHFSLSCIGEGHGNPPQCSCLEYPRDSGAWWAAVHGVTQSRTRLKRLSSSIGEKWKSSGKKFGWGHLIFVGQILPALTQFHF